jgi:hypothetical protein
MTKTRKHTTAQAAKAAQGAHAETQPTPEQQAQFNDALNRYLSDPDNGTDEDPLGE